MFKSNLFCRLMSSGCLLLCVIFLLFSSIATASLVQLQSTGQSVPNYSSTLTFDQYDGADPLSSVVITLEVIVDDAFFGFDNDSPVATTVTVNLDVTGGISSVDVDLPAIDSALAMFSKTVGLAADNGDTRGYDSVADIDMKSFNTSDFSAVSSASTNTLLGAYQGSDTFDITVDFSQVLDITGNSGVSMMYIPALAEANVTVEYLTIPEPVSLALLGIGALIARRRPRR